ncbi:MAG: EAL domain-containing protein [Helicobacteraceae bacterium]|jgi:diguanylate cyclase (GGDEF)-like protein/PAS domain S-box-containing protein|nr:EAL domain-containing protein [Helicobacteraceae bacterium]
MVLETKRKYIFIFVTILLLLAYPLLRSIEWHGNTTLHTLMETIATLLAMFVGILSLIHYHTNKSNQLFLLIGVGFFGTAFLDGYHTIVTSIFFAELFPSIPSSLIPWSWIASRLFLSIFLFWSYIHFRYRKNTNIDERALYTFVSISTLATFLFFAFVPLPNAYYHEFILSRPEELIPALFFSLALYGYIVKGNWKNDIFEFWLTLSLIISVIAQIIFMSTSEVLFDIEFDAAHLLKKVSYIFVLTGLLKSIYKLVLHEKIQREELNTTQKQLDEKNQLLDNIIDNIPHMIFLKHASDLRYALLNKSGEELTGFSQKILLDHNDYDVFPKDQADFFIQKDREVLQNGIIVDIPEEPIETPHGTRILHTKKIPIKDDHGQPRYLLGISEDITERIEVETALYESEQFLRESQKIAGLGSYTLDFRTRTWTSSEILDQLFGIDTGYERSIVEWEAIVHPDDRIKMKHYLRDEVINKGKPFDQEYRIIRQNDKSVRWMHCLGKLEYDSNGSPVKMVGTVQDNTEQKRSSDSLLKLSLAVEQSPNSIVITDLDSNIEYVNNMFTKVSGYSKDEVVGKNPRIFKSYETPQSTYDDMWAHLTRGDIWHGELINRRKDNSTYIELTTISPVKQRDGKITNYVAIKEDITEKKEAEAYTENLAHFDQLTGLPNRRTLDDRVKYLLGFARRNNEPLTVMFLDLDNFKNINDSLGLTIGDQVLIGTAKRIERIVREVDTVSRFGGDEFIMLFPNTDSNAAMHIATKLIEEISKPSIVEDNELTITPSIGITIYPDDGKDFETLLKNADTAMYRVKNSSRNGFHFFTQEMQLNLARNLQLENALRHALKRNELQLYYQPQISISTGQIIGAEALLRWHHPELGMISPAEFIPIAESSGQIIEIGEWVLRTAIGQTKEWMDSGFTPMIIAVNLSAVQFRQQNLLKLVTEILAEVQLPNEYLELELTEAVTMHNPESVIDVMNKFHEQGIRMSIDDFGTGYSSLSYLKKFKVYKLKIDQSFIRDISTDPDDRAIVSAIIDMARNLGLQTIAEGVETAEQLAFLRLHGCDEVQGYYFSKPIPAVEFEEFRHNNIDFNHTK